jgi:hypothetical protein
VPAAPTHGDVIVSNHVDFVDILYFAFRYGAVFAFPARHWPSRWRGDRAAAAHCASAVGDSTRCVSRSVTLVPVAADRLRLENDEFKRDAVSIGEASERAFREQLGPIVLFAEGCVSNGRAVLPFVPVLANAKLPPRAHVHVVALKYAKEGVAHEFVVRDGLSHVLWLLRAAEQLAHCAQARRRRAAERRRRVPLARRRVPRRHSRPSQLGRRRRRRHR